MVNVVNISNDANLVAPTSERVEEFQRMLAEPEASRSYVCVAIFFQTSTRTLDRASYSASMSSSLLDLRVDQCWEGFRHAPE